MKSRAVVIVMFALMLSALAGCASPSRVSPSTSARMKTEQPQTQTPTQTQKDGALQVVEAKYVCMINNQRFNKVQIPIEVEGRTYYGCCEMCKGKLGGDPKSRVAVDPVSGKEVDKARAVIGVDADGAALYFENAENLKRYQPGTKS
jgi:YHS domain-containing protein